MLRRVFAYVYIKMHMHICNYIMQLLACTWIYVYIMCDLLNCMCNTQPSYAHGVCTTPLQKYMCKKLNAQLQLAVGHLEGLVGKFALFRNLSRGTADLAAELSQHNTTETLQEASARCPGCAVSNEM